MSFSFTEKAKYEDELRAMTIQELDAEWEAVDTEYCESLSLNDRLAFIKNKAFAKLGMVNREFERRKRSAA
jgi:hypothetical protein